MRQVLFFLSLLAALVPGLRADPTQTPTPLPAPSYVSVTAVINDTATLYWDAVQGASGYELYSDGNVYDRVRNNVAFLRGLTVGREYHFTVAAINGEPGDQSVAATFTAEVRLDPNDYDVFHLVAETGTNATVVKDSPGQLLGWYVTNRSNGFRKLAFHDLADTPVAGQQVYFTLDIPAGGGANVFNHDGIGFGAGIAFTTVTGTADTDDTPVADGDLNINLFYR